MDKIDEYFKKALLNKKGTTTVFRSHIQKYFKIINQDMNTYFDKKQPYEEHIRQYWEYLQGKAPNTKGVAISSIKGFLKRFDKTTKDLDIWYDISARMRGKTIPIHEEYVPDLDELKQILHYCDIRTKTTIMIALSSGMRISEVVKLLPSDLHFKEEPTRINVRSEIAKNGRRRTTFITPETTDLLKEWFRIRDEYYKKSMQSMNFKEMQYLKDRDDPRVFPYHTNRIREAFNRACDNAGFTGKTSMKGDFDFGYKRKRRKLHYHNLRKFFRTYFGNSDLAEHLMGHTGYLSTYRQYNDKQLAKEYMKHMENVTIFERSVDLTEVNKSLEEKDKQIQDLKFLMDEMKAQILELRLEKLEKANGFKK